MYYTINQSHSVTHTFTPITITLNRNTSPNRERTPGQYFTKQHNETVVLTKHCIARLCTQTQMMQLLHMDCVFLYA